MPLVEIRCYILSDHGVVQAERFNIPISFAGSDLESDMQPLSKASVVQGGSRRVPQSARINNRAPSPSRLVAHRSATLNLAGPIRSRNLPLKNSECQGFPNWDDPSRLV